MSTFVRVAVSSFAAALIMAATCASAQNIDQLQGMINAEMGQMNANINAGQQQINAMVQQRMQDPQVQASYQAYLRQCQMSRQYPMDFPTYTYNYIYTNGFSAQGTALARANENANNTKVYNAWQGEQQAEAARGQAQAGYAEGYQANNAEFGNTLQGNSTFVAPDGEQMVLPHTWADNTTNYYNGNYYHVDQSGNYYVYGTDGNWYPLRK